MTPSAARRFMLNQGRPLNESDVANSLLNVFDMARHFGGSRWADICFMMAYAFCGFRREILCYSEGWFALPAEHRDAAQPHSVA